MTIVLQPKAWPVSWSAGSQASQSVIHCSQSFWLQRWKYREYNNKSWFHLYFKSHLCKHWHIKKLSLSVDNVFRFHLILLVIICRGHILLLGTHLLSRACISFISKLIRFCVRWNRTGGMIKEVYTCYEKHQRHQSQTLGWKDFWCVCVCVHTVYVCVSVLPCPIGTITFSIAVLLAVPSSYII